MNKQMRLCLRLVLACGVFLPALARAGVDTAWVRRYDGPANGGDAATELAVDSAGDVYVAGYSAGVGTGDDFVTIKYYPNGDTAWVRRCDFGSDDTPTGMGVDRQGNVYVTGWGNGQMHTVKYSSGGQLLWSVPYGGQSGATDLALDAGGNVMLCGNLLTAPPDSYNLTTMKYRPSGDTAWARVLDWAGHTEDARALAVGVLGDVAATAEYYDSNPGGHYLVVRYDSAGMQQWSTAYDGPADWDSPVDVATDAAGCVYVTGSSESTTSSWDYLTIKCSPSGETLWTRRYNGPTDGDDEATAVAVDGVGSAVATGYAQFEAGNRDYATVKYDSAGTRLWVARYDGPASGLDQARAISIDVSGNIYVTGSARIQPSLVGCATVKYDPDGNTAWVATYTTPTGTVSYGTKIAVGIDGCVYVAGIGDNDILTIKYVQKGGVAEERVTPVASRLSLVAEPSIFSSRTVLHLFVTKATAARVAVYDAEGRCVKTLLSGSGLVSNGDVTWDGRDERGMRLRPGVYVVVLSAGKERAKAKVVMSE